MERHRESSQEVSVAVCLIFSQSYFPDLRNGAVRYESVMRLRNKLEELGKMEGVNTKEKGLWKCGKVCIDWCYLSP